MTTFMEQVADTGRWIGDMQPDLDGPSESFPGENASQRVAQSPRARRRTLLTSQVEEEILPRLVRIRRHPGGGDGGGSEVTTESDTAELVRLLLADTEDGAVGYIDALRLRGATPASLYLGLVTQAARSLGALWEEDRCDFAQVTIGMGRLQRILRGLSPHFQMAGVRRTHTESILLVPAPGEQHTLGLMILAEFFSREGWLVAGGPGTTSAEAASIVSGTWIDVAGFSIGSMSRLDGLAHCIRSVRRASHNPDLYVMVGGPLFLAQPDLVTRVGADAAATDAASAVRQAGGLLAVRAAAG